MKNGFIKAAAASPEIKVADCDYNANGIIREVKCLDKESSAKLIVFPELSVTGYTCGDLFLQKVLLEGAIKALERIADDTAETEAVISVGIPLKHEGKLYNCAAVIYKGKLLGVVPKTHIPNYSEFYELRHFSAAPAENDEIDLLGQIVPFGTKLLFKCRQLENFCFAVEICEDLWVPSPPSVRHTAAGATIIVNLSASDETIGKDVYRRSLVSSHSARLVCGYVYADAGHGESTTDMVFGGHNLISENGTLISESRPFSYRAAVSEIDVEKIAGERQRMSTYPAYDAKGYDTIYFDMDASKATELTRKIDAHPFVPDDKYDRDERCEAILAMQSHGLKKRIEHADVKTVIIGMSGGLDSTLAMLVTIRAMDMLRRPRTDIIAVTMPCFGTTERTKGNAETLCEKLGVTFRCVNITESVRKHFDDIGHDENVHDVTYENCQARERTQVLMDISNQTGGIVVGTGDLSELALGWATYNGDHKSMYGVNASVPKTLVRHIVKYAADVSEDKALRDTLLDILDTPVSPELLPADKGEISQKTDDIVGPYELHDFFIYYMVRFAFPPNKIFCLAEYAFKEKYDRETIIKWLKKFYWRFFSQQFKRSCIPDGPKVGTVTLSPRGDWRMPSDASVKLWIEEIEKI